MTNSPTQLSLAISLRDEATFSNFYAEDEEKGMALQVLKGLVLKQNLGGCFIWGAPSSGLTHLLQAVCHSFSERASRQNLNAFAQYLPLEELSFYRASEVCEGLDQASLVCVDDIHLISGKPDWEQAIFHLFNRLKDSGRAMLVSAHESPSELALALPDLKSRILGSSVYQVSPLTDSGKEKALIMRSRLRGMEMTEEVSAYILRRAPRDPSKLFQLLELLDEASMQQQRKLTIPFVKHELGFP